MRAAVYEKVADTSVQIAFTLKIAKELLSDLEKEKATGAKVVSPALSRRINGVSAAGTDALLMAAKMSGAMVELASFEATQECNKKNSAMRCSEELSKSVAKIQTAMDILTTAVKLFFSAVLIGTGRNFIY